MKSIFKSKKLKMLMGLKAHHDGYKPTNSLGWWTAVGFVR